LENLTLAKDQWNSTNDPLQWLVKPVNWLTKQDQTENPAVQDKRGTSEHEQ
jgi:hypothetical protein|tara:strand:- start:559 stop:711 length:153 start_codon:yes stop_codon:yes gene_type:complete